MQVSNTSSFKIVKIRKKERKKIGEFRLFHSENLLIFTDFEANTTINKGGASDFFRLLNLYRKAEQYDTIENLDGASEKAEELLNIGKIIL